MENWTSWTTTSIQGKSDFKAHGFLRTYALAGRLCDELENLVDEPKNERRIAISKILCSEHTVANQTGEVFERVLKKRADSKGVLRVDDLRLCPSPELTPGTKEYLNEKCVTRKLELTRCELSRAATPATAYVVVGHQPQLTGIARALLKKPIGNSLPGNSLPLGSSEIACIQLGNCARLLWLLTAKGQDSLDELKDKIKSKYDVAKFFLGAFVVNTSLLLNAGLWGDPKLWAVAHSSARLTAYAAIIAALISLTFAAATLFSYDRLMMPERFWSEGTEPDELQGLDRKLWWRLRRLLRKSPKWSVSRPPSQAIVILYYEMMHIWKAFFLPAIVFAFAAIGFFVVALASRSRSLLPKSLILFDAGWGLLVTLSVIVGLAFLIPNLLFYERKKPRLGSED
jgi:phosphohistidine phosphatase SixA